MSGPHILVVRIGSMGDVIHALPAVATLKHSFPHCRLSWVISPRWAPLLDGNPFVDQVVPFDRTSISGIAAAWRILRSGRCDLAVDFQGLIQSALIATIARPDRIFGFHQSQIREKPAALFYSHKTQTTSAHVVERNLELAVEAGGSNVLHTFPLPEGRLEGDLPEGDFILASPVAGWAAKQWPAANYAKLAQLIRQELRLPLVLNGSPASGAALSAVPFTHTSLTGLAGLIYATRRATAVVGVDSGPMHLAAALGKPGVAVMGPTDPSRNGPYGDSFTVLRSPQAQTSYKRHAETAASMRDISPEQVLDALKARLACRAHPTGLSHN